MLHRKCTLVLATLAMLFITAFCNLQAQNSPLRFQHRAEKLVKVMEDFGKRFNIELAYANEEVKNSSLPAASHEGATILELLNKVLAPGGFSAMLSGSNYIVKKMALPKKETGTQVLQGIVTESGNAVQGATIFISQEDRSPVIVVADENGRFSKTVPAVEGTVEISAVGYVPVKKKFTASAEGTIRFELTKDGQQMEDVVVTALGIRREEKALGYAVSKLQNDDLTNAISNNWSNTLTGKVAGLNIIKSGGGPAGSNKIILRGETSLDGNSEALIVIDGVIMNAGSKMTGASGSNAYLDGDSPTDFGSNLNDINPEDVESITVLKGPGAAALYGARGANGAIIITTKSGKPLKKGLGITFNSNATFESISRWPDYQYEYGQGATGQDTWYSYNATADGASTRSTSSAWGPKFDGQSYFQYDPVTRTTGAQRTPWVPYKNNRKDFFETGKTFTNSITMEGGNQLTSARLSLTRLDNSWIVPNTGYERTTVALSVNQKVSDKLQISTRINYTNRGSDNLPSTGYNNQTIMYFIRGMTPNVNLDWFKNYWMPGKEGVEQTRPFSSLLDNPYLIANDMLNTSNRNGLIGNIAANYTLVKNLNLQLRSSIDYSTEARAQQRPMGSQKFVDGMYRTQNIFSQELNYDFLLRYDHTISSKLKANYSVGGSRMRNRYIRDEVRADKLLYPGVYNFANSKNVPVSLPYRAQYAVNSLYGLLQFGYNNYLFLDVTGRNDWSSTLATPASAGNSSFFYPSLNLSAIVSEMTRLPAPISFLKLRGSWAQVGSGTNVPFRTAYAYNATLFPSGLANPTAIANPSLTYLLTTSIEVGADIRFFKNRLGIDVALYKNNTNDQIFNVPVDRATGYAATVLNAGEVQNKGIEVQLTGNPLRSKRGLNWNITGTFSTNQSRVVELTEGISSYVMSTGPANRGSIEARPGGRMGDLYGLGYQRAPDGQILYNAQGLPLLSENMIYLGNTNPDWKASFGSEFRFRQFQFSFLFDGQFGGVAYSLTHAVLAEEGKLKKTIPGRYNGIIGDGVQDLGDGHYAKNTVVVTNIQSYYNAHFTRDNIEANTFNTDFIKLRETRLDYTLSAKWLQALHFQRATLGIYGRDLFMLTNWPAFDPEFGTLGVNTSTGDAQINAGFEIGQFPSTRSYGINLTVGF